MKRLRSATLKFRQLGRCSPAVGPVCAVLLGVSALLMAFPLAEGLAVRALGLAEVIPEHLQSLIVVVLGLGPISWAYFGYRVVRSERS